MRKIFKRLLIIIILLLFLTLAVGVFYNIYYGNIKDGSDIEVSGPLSINYINGNKLFINKKKKVNISIFNSSEDDIYYYIEFINLKNIKKEVEYSITSESINITDKLNNFNTVVGDNILIKAGEEEYLTINFECSEKLLYSLEINVQRELESTETFAELILKNSSIKDNSTTTIGKEIASEDEGLIKGKDDSGVTYYFRGNTVNNNVKINDNMFKIVRINGDGTIKLISSNITNEVKSYYSDINNINYSSSDTNTFLKSWLKDTLGKYESLVSNYKFCNDNTKKDGIYLAYNRLTKDYIPSFTCIGTKYTSKVGLLTADEAIFAGASFELENKSYYLYSDDITSSYYLMTAGKMENNIFYPFNINSTGTLNINDAGNSLRNIRPVININNSATAIGTGTIEDPYILTLE